MAFRELREDEIILLNEFEKAQYEKDVKIHQERMALVEKLEQIENANIQYQKPKFKRIKPIPKLDMPKYQPVGIIKIKLPKSETDRNLFLQNLQNQSISAIKVRKRILENASVCVKIKPVSKVNIPSLKPYQIMPQRIVSLKKTDVKVPAVSFTGNTKHMIQGVSNFTKAIDVPKCKFTKVPQIEITDIPKKCIPIIMNAQFKYEKNLAKVPHISISLPDAVKFNFDSKVKIKNMPSLYKVEASNTTFHAPKCETKDIPKIYVTVPEVSFEGSKYKIQGIPKMHIPLVNDDFSAINRQIGTVSLRKVQPFEKQIVPVPSIKSYVNPQCTVSLLPLKPVSIPSVDKFTPPSSKNAVVLTPQKLKEPHISVKPIKKVTIEKDRIPKINIHMPDYSKMDVENILNIAHRELQGV